MPQTTVNDLLAAAKWVSKHRQEIVEQRPSRADLVARINQECGTHIGNVSLKAILEDQKLTWTTKVKRTSQEDLRLSVKVLSGALMDLYTRLGENPRPELKALFEATQDQDSNGSA